MKGDLLAGEPGEHLDRARKLTPYPLFSHATVEEKGFPHQPKA